ncbi:hypothetical protein F4782DRAFT_544968 [Xylaria castorea]|nr:hypothetical protein F4782DRAFT_544968 [Xylaria castorea]
MTNTSIESTNFQVPPGVLLPGGCYFELDKVGLPTGPGIKHSAEPLCRCAGRQEDILIKYLAIWQSEYSERLRISKLSATAMVIRRIEEWQLKVPRWLEPIVKEWVEMLKNHCEQ